MTNIPLTIPYEFEELPLILTEDGYSAGLIDGMALILVDEGGEWSIGSIRVRLDKTEWVGAGLELKRVNHPTKWEPVSMFLEGVIRKVLRQEPSWKARIEEKVAEAIRQPEREYEAEPYEALA